MRYIPTGPNFEPPQDPRPDAAHVVSLVDLNDRRRELDRLALIHGRKYMEQVRLWVDKYWARRQVVYDGLNARQEAALAIMPEGFRELAATWPGAQHS